MQPFRRRAEPSDGWSYSLSARLLPGRRLRRTVGTNVSAPRGRARRSVPRKSSTTCVMAITLKSAPGRSTCIVRPRRTRPRRRSSRRANKRWPDGASPSTGPGRKHDRPIVLTDWQRAIVDRQPRALPAAALIHSDACRTVNRFKTKLPSGRVAEYAYPRYFFSEPVSRHPRHCSASTASGSATPVDAVRARKPAATSRGVCHRGRAEVASATKLVGPSDDRRERLHRRTGGRAAVRADDP